MKFRRIRAERFGPLAGLDTGEERALSNLVAVLGPNEAGKSAVHNLLQALIHGFYPANRDQYPFAPWSGGDIDISAQLVLDGGEEAEVHRRLLSTPRGELVRAAGTETLDNRSLPFATHVDERIYGQVYAVSLADLARVQEEAWAAVQDELVVGMGARDFRPPREVIRELSAEAEKLWRPDRRGKPRYRELRAELGELRSRRSEAEQSDRRLREDEATLAGNERREEELRSVRTSAAARLERLRELVPVRNRLARLDELEDSVGDPVELEGLPRDPAARLHELEERAERGALEREELGELDRRIRDQAASLLEGGRAESEDLDQFARPFLTLPVDRVRERVAAFEEERRRKEDLEEELGGVGAREPAAEIRLPAWTVAVAAVGGALLAWWGMTGIGALGIAGGLLFAAGSWFLLRNRLQAERVEGENSALRRDEEDLRRRLAELGRRVERRRADVVELLGPLGLPEPLLQRPSSALVGKLESFIRLLEDRGSRLRAREATGTDPEAAEAELRAFIQRLERAGGGTDPEGMAVVERRLRELEHLERLREELVAEAGDLESVRSRIRELEGEGEKWEDVPERIARTERTIEDAERELQELGGESGELRERVKRLRKEDTVDLIDGRILEIEEEMREVARERDRKFVLARLLERAELRFRMEHQPDLIRRTEEHLSAFTGGRYERILLDGDGGAEGLRLHAEHLPGPLPVSAPLSTGTREQVYVALRLAIVDHLDDGRETLPLLLDETLVNWDPARRAGALDVLAKVSERRQTFLFTCHPELAEEVRARGGGVLELEAPVAASADG